MLSIDSQVQNLVQIALKEDLDVFGDLTSQSVLYPDSNCRAKLIAKQQGVLAGIDIFEYVFKVCNSNIEIIRHFDDGQALNNKDIVCEISGNSISILTAERTALNFLQRLSGIAALTADFVKAVSGTNAKILDTRKTTPGFRVLEKYAVRMGGGHNHRMGLYDMILIKDNHIAAAGGITNAVNNAMESVEADNLGVKIEVEVKNIQELHEVVGLKVHRVLLDNMSIEEIKESTQIVNGKIETEISGGVTLDTVRTYAETGVDFISVGALTHSTKAMDFTLLID